MLYQVKLFMLVVAVARVKLRKEYKAGTNIAHVKLVMVKVKLLVKIAELKAK